MMALEEETPGSGQEETTAPAAAAAAADPSGVETREAKRPREEQPQVEADSQQSVIDGQGTTVSAEAATPAAVKKEHQDELELQATGAFALLTDDALLTPIFEFVGVFEYRFVAILSKRFRKVYSEFQKKRIHQAPKASSLHPRYFTTSLTSTASVAESIERAKVLMKDMNKARESNHFIKLRKRQGDGTSLGSFYDVVYRKLISGTNQIQIQIFHRDKVALRYGNVEILQWLRANGCAWDIWTCSQAASYGHLEVLQWLRANGCPWHDATCERAARNGHLEVLKWARANGCPWSEYTCSQAASNGHLEILQWALANGCPWNERTCAVAEEMGHLEVLQWLRANGCPEYL